MTASSYESPAYQERSLEGYLLEIGVSLRRSAQSTDATDAQTSSAPCPATTSSNNTGCEKHPQEIPEFAAGHQQLAADVRQPYWLRHGLLVELPIMSDGPVVITG
jgi:hypothetical protein